MKNLAVVVVAGGSGTRMGSTLPKQFIELGGKPILMRTIENFSTAAQIVVVLPHDQIDHWKLVCECHNFAIRHTIVSGGETRFQSVKNGLAAVGDSRFVAVQDGVRPFASKELIERTLSAAELFGAAVPVVEVTDSLREITPEGSQIVPRERYRAVQTPQIFNYVILTESYKTDYDPRFTDDASVVEAAGYKIALADGEPENIKITTPIDLSLAQQIFELKNVSLWHK